MKNFIPQLQEALYGDAICYLLQLMREMSIRRTSITVSRKWFASRLDMNPAWNYMQSLQEDHLAIEIESSGEMYIERYYLGHHSEFHNYQTFDQGLVELLKTFLSKISEIEAKKTELTTLIRRAGALRHSLSRIVLSEITIEVPNRPVINISTFTKRKEPSKDIAMAELQRLIMEEARRLQEPDPFDLFNGYIEPEEPIRNLFLRDLERLRR